MVRFVLSRVQPADFDVFVPVEFAAFVNDGCHFAMLGPDSPRNIAHAKEVWLKAMQTDPADVWLKITDEDAESRIVCIGNWKIYPTYVAAEVDARAAAIEKLTAQPSYGYDDPNQKADAIMLTKEFLAKRYEKMREPHILLNLLFTDPDYHGKGAGRMMVRWGTDLADHLMLSCWVEASQEGNRLYSSMGYEDVETPYRKAESLPLPLDYFLKRRPVKGTTIDGKGR